MNTTYNTKLTVEQKANLKEYKQSAKNAGGVIVFIRDTTLAMLPDGYYGNWYIGKAVASQWEAKLRAKVGMFYALERAHNMNKTVSDKVFNQILKVAKDCADVTAHHYDKKCGESFEVVRYL